MGTLATKLVLLRPRDPESKGIVERRNGWFETSFMPGRSFASPADFNQQFTGWLDGANQKVVRTTGARPVDLLETDRAAMLTLPPVAPVRPSERTPTSATRSFAECSHPAPCSARTLSPPSWT